MKPAGSNGENRSTATHELRVAMTATREARETLSLFARIGMDDPSKLEAYTRRLKKRERAERQIRDGLLRLPS